MSERQLFEICPDCNGNGFIAHMAANPTLDETIEECTRCEDWKGMVPVEPVATAVSNAEYAIMTTRGWWNGHGQFLMVPVGAGIGDTDVSD